MRVNGSTPSTGPLANKPADARKAAKPDGKSFGAAFDKAAKAASSPSQGAVPGASADAIAPQPPPSHVRNAGTVDPDALQNPPAPHSESHMDLIRFRMQQGYYNSKKVDDALSEKLSDYFDELG